MLGKLCVVILLKYIAAAVAVCFNCVAVYMALDAKRQEVMSLRPADAPLLLGSPCIVL